MRFTSAFIGMSLITGLLYIAVMRRSNTLFFSRFICPFPFYRVVAAIHRKDGLDDICSSVLLKRTLCESMIMKAVRRYCSIRRAGRVRRQQAAECLFGGCHSLTGLSTGNRLTICVQRRLPAS